MPHQVAVDERLPVDRLRDRAPDADVPADALVVEAEVDERRLLELDQLNVAIRRQPVDVEQGRVLDAVDLPALERRGALAVVENRDPADPVEVGRAVVLLPGRSRAAVALPPGDVEVRAGDGLDECERTGPVARRPTELLSHDPPARLVVDRRVPGAKQPRHAGARLVELDEDLVALGAYAGDVPPEEGVDRCLDRVAVEAERLGDSLRVAGLTGLEAEAWPDPETPDVVAVGILTPRFGEHRAELAVRPTDGDGLVDRAPCRVDVRAGGVAAREVVVVPLAQHAAAPRRLVVRLAHE